MQSTTHALQRQPVPEQIEVTLLLSGGQKYTLSLPTDDLLLRQLFEVVINRAGKRTRRLFQIPIQQGKAMLAFPCEHLVGVITNPPLVVQQPLSQQPRLQPSVLPKQPDAPVQSAQNLLLADFVQFDNFLSPAQHQYLLRYVLQHEASFANASTATGDVNYRRSVVLYEFPFAAQLMQQVRAVLPRVFAQLRVVPFSISQIETQITAHSDGNYYKIHNDNGSADTASRELTYVYYFNQEPKAFSGGELRLYDGRLENNVLVKASSFKTIEPRNNSIVFFLSRYMHEVLPVCCPSKAFADSRFTVNGWVRRARKITVASSHLVGSHPANSHPADLHNRLS